MAIGDYAKTVYINGQAPAINAVNLNKNETKTAELDAGVAAHIADYVRQPGYGVTTGSANTYALTLNPVPAEYVDGMGIAVKINVANTGASTINVNSLGVKAIVDSKGTALISGKLKLNGTYSLKYNTTSGNFILQGEGGDYGTADAPKVLIGYSIGTDAGIVNGTMPSYTGDVVGDAVAVIGTTIKVGIPGIGGHFAGSGCWVTYSDPDFIAANLVKDKNVFGLVGTAVPAGDANYTYKTILGFSDNVPISNEIFLDEESNTFIISNTLSGNQTVQKYSLTGTLISSSASSSSGANQNIVVDNANKHIFADKTGLLEYSTLAATTGRQHLGDFYTGYASQRDVEDLSTGTIYQFAYNTSTYLITITALNAAGGVIYTKTHQPDGGSADLRSCAVTANYICCTLGGFNYVYWFSKSTGTFVKTTTALGSGMYPKRVMGSPSCTFAVVIWESMLEIHDENGTRTSYLRSVKGGSVLRNGWIVLAADAAMTTSTNTPIGFLILKPDKTRTYIPCRLDDSIWNYHPFDIDTRTNEIYFIGASSTYGYAESSTTYPNVVTKIKLL